MREFIDIIVESVSVPTQTFPSLYHIGTLDASQKRDGSYEGAGLSVSLNPEAWRRIARGHVSGDLWVCTKSGNRFIDAHRVNKGMRAEIAKWATEHGFAEMKATYRVSWFDDELDQEVYSDFETLAAAEEEAESMDVEVQTIPGSLVGTAALKARTRTKADPNVVFDLILTVYAEEQGYDGVWWNDKLDIANYSAPRGVIVPSKISDWQIAKAE